MLDFATVASSTRKSYHYFVPERTLWALRWFTVDHSFVLHLLQHVFVVPFNETAAYMVSFIDFFHCDRPAGELGEQHILKVVQRPV